MAQKLEDELLDQNTPSAQLQRQGLGPVRQLVDPTDPTQDFLVTMMELADSKGLLDEAPPGEEVAEDEFALPDGDITEFLSQEEMTMLFAKWQAIPPETQSQLLEALRAESPEMAQQAQVAIQFMSGGQ